MAAFVVSTAHHDNMNHKPSTSTPGSTKNYSELLSFKTPVHERTRYIISDLEKFDWQRRRYHILIGSGVSWYLFAVGRSQ